MNLIQIEPFRPEMHAYAVLTTSIAIQLEGAAPNAAYFKNMWIKLFQP